MNINNEMPSLGSVARLFGGAVMDEVLTERVGLVVIDGRKVADGDAADFKEVVTATFGVEVTEWLSGAVGSAWYDDCIFIGADVPEDAKVFVTYHEFKHYLDFVGRGVVPSDEHASIRSSRIEKECDLYALRRVIQESGKESAEKAFRQQAVQALTGHIRESEIHHRNRKRKAHIQSESAAVRNDVRRKDL